MNKLLFITLFLLVFTKMVVGSDTLMIYNTNTQYEVSNYLRYFTDCSSNITIDQIVNNKLAVNYQEINQNVTNLGISKCAHWFVFDLVNRSSIEEWILEIEYPTLNDVIFYILNPENKLDTIIYSGKDRLKKNQQNYTYSIHFDQKFINGKPYRILFRVQTESFIILPMHIMSVSSFIEKDRIKFAYLYLLYGIILSLVAFNFILFLLTRELNYLLLTVYLAILSMNAYYLYGFGIDFFANIDPFLKGRMRQILFGVASFTFLLFTSNYLELRKYKNLFRIVMTLIVLSLIYIPILFIGSIRQSNFSKFTPIFFFIGATISFLAGVYTYRKGERMALYYIISFSMIVLSSAIYFLTLFNIIPFNFLTFNINSIATILFGMLLTIGLVEKITAIRQEKAKTIQLESMNQHLTSEIEEKAKIGKALRESEEKFRLLFNLAPQIIIVTNYQTGQIIDCNYRFLKLTGLKKENLTGKTTLDFNLIKKSDRDFIIHQLNDNNQIEGYEIDVKIKEGEIINCLLYSYLVRVQNEKNIITILSDVSQLKKSQQEIKKLSVAIDQSANSIVITDCNGVIEYVNNSFSQITGYSFQEAIGENPSILKSNFHPLEFYKSLWKTILSGNIWKGELYNRKKNGNHFWESSTISPVFNEKGEITNFLAIKEDITERKEQQEKLQKSEIQLKDLNSTKDKFFSIIAHDLMNPFNAMIGFTGLLIESINNGKNEEGLNYANYIDYSSRRIFDLLQNLLIWSRTQSGKIAFTPSFINVVELVTNAIDVLRSIAHTKNLEIEIVINENSIIFVDQNMIGTVIRNLVSNAIKFSESGGKINISVQKTDSYFLICVSDCGIGIASDQLKELFVLDKTVSLVGTEGEVGIGLGLVLCKDFVNLHGGEIWAESDPDGDRGGKGSKFFFTIPILLNSE